MAHKVIRRRTPARSSGCGKACMCTLTPPQSPAFNCKIHFEVVRNDRIILLIRMLYHVYCCYVNRSHVDDYGIRKDAASAYKEKGSFLYHRVWHFLYFLLAN